VNAPRTDNLPLRHRTPDTWAAVALDDPLALLADHAYLERKAASNALELVNRWPHTAGPGPWVKTLAAIARDETTHLHAVSQLLAARGGTLPRTHRNAYATALHALVRRGRGPHELLDRLLVSALIEARSCERFEVLAKVALDRELADFYRNLCQSEYSHFTVFLQLAGLFVQPSELASRWHEMLDAEAAIIQVQIAGPRIHGGT
jgi:tRNA 2-(methylsulfanyl)-N6-isopentenyladenosine37 hydroxylase